MTARHLVIGLDGADLDLVRALGPAKLPTLHRLMEEGTYAALESVKPPATLPNWTTFLTGVDPGVHGVFDFTVRSGYRVQFTGGTVREAPTVFARLDRMGLATACVGFPATYPPERLAHGVFMSGWDAPVAFEADRSFVWPPSLYDAIAARFGTPSFDDVNEFDAEREGWHARLGAALVARIERKTELAEYLLAERPFDLFAFYFGESDTASHHLFSLHDVNSPRHPARTHRDEREGLTRVYEALDAAVLRLWRAAGEAVDVTILSDHGSGGSSDRVFYLNRALAEAGLLRFRASALETRLVGLAKEKALTLLPPRLRERIFRMGGALLPGMLESRARFGAIDFSRTTAFSDELNYFPAIHFNVRGREPDGIVDPRDLRRLRLEVEAALGSLRDPDRGTPIVRAVHAREELFDGPFVHRAPDLLLELHRPDGYAYNLMPSTDPRAGRDAFRKLDPEEYLGRKGRSLPGSHRDHGFFVMAGPRVRSTGAVEARIADVTATLLARMDLAVPPAFAGRVLWEALLDADREARTLPDVAPPRKSAPLGEGLVEARLRALGYVE